MKEIKKRRKRSGEGIVGGIIVGGNGEKKSKEWRELGSGCQKQ